jgi:hypothetical protein
MHEMPPSPACCEEPPSDIVQTGESNEPESEPREPNVTSKVPERFVPLAADTVTLPLVAVTASAVPHVDVVVPSDVGCLRWHFGRCDRDGG